MSRGPGWAAGCWIGLSGGRMGAGGARGAPQGVLGVRPPGRGTGVGSGLVDRLEQRLNESGVNTVYLGTHKGTPAEAVSRRHGGEGSAAGTGPARAGGG